MAVGTDGLFIEVHDHPEKALSDGANALQIDEVEHVLSQLQEIDQLVKEQQTTDN